MGVVLLSKAVDQDRSIAPFVAGGMLLMAWGVHQRRADHHFLRFHLRRPRMAMALEYAALASPVMLGLLAARAWVAASWLLVVVVLPWSPVARDTSVRGAWLRRWLPVHLFEWKGMVQNTHPWSLLLWTASLAFSWMPVLPLFLLGVIAMLVAGAQEQCEPRAMLLATAKSAPGLLKKKVLGSMRAMSLIVLPVLVIATAFRPPWWWIHTLIGMGMLVLVGYAIVLKYANYRPNERLDANGANVGVAAVFAILPGLSLVPLIMLLTELPKARANLNAYFHDHDH
ncbi:MAG TPA: hypothetical protein PLB89_11785 [Flavobacteriales bacterium]|nr:hypothetical protein [Flavobacteriales bacterium]